MANLSKYKNEKPTGVNEFMIYNTDHWTVTNGGCCLEWKVPNGTNSIKFEVLGGGGPGGSGAGDYEMPVGGQGGGYAAKTITSFNADFSDGDLFTLCAGGTSQCSCCCHCCMATRQGCTSFATGPGLTNFCAVGGLGGHTMDNKQSDCYDCHMMTQCCIGQYNSSWASSSIHTQFYGADYGFTGTSGSMHSDYNCCDNMYSFAGGPTGPFTVSGTVVGSGGCTGGKGCCSGHSMFPAGGGVSSPTSSSNACWGGFGAGGLVKVTYS